MRIFLRTVWLLLMVPGLAYGQTAAHPADSSTNTSDVGTQLDALREALLQTQQQVAAQQQEIQVLKTQLKSGQSGTAGGALIIRCRSSSAQSDAAQRESVRPLRRRSTAGVVNSVEPIC